MRRGIPMSRHETPMTEGFWKSSAHGLFIAEYPLVQRGADRAPRYVDGLILPDEPHGRGKWHDYASLSGKRVIVIQTKIGRIGMYLMGQALFSEPLLLKTALKAGAMHRPTDGTTKLIEPTLPRMRAPSVRSGSLTPRSIRSEGCATPSRMRPRCGRR